MLAAQLGLGRPSGIDGHRLTVTFFGEAVGAAAMLSAPDHRATIARVLADRYTPAPEIEFVTSANESDPQIQRGPSANELLAKSPRLRDLVKRVDGEIIGIRSVRE